MDADPTGAATAASPPATESAAAAFEREFKAVNDGAASPAAPLEADAKVKAEGDQHPEAQAEKAAEADEKKADDDKPTKADRRWDQLLKERSELREAKQRAEQEYTQKELRYQVALKKVLGDMESLKARLGQYEDLNAPEFQLEDLQGRQRVQADLQAEERKLHERFQQEREHSLVEDARRHLFDAMDSALAAYPHLTRAQLQAKFKAHAEKNPDVSFDEAPALFDQLAQSLDEEVFARYEPRILEKHKAKLSAPSPITSSGTVRSPPVARSRDEMVEDLERVGPGLFD